MAWVSFGGTESGGAVTYNGPKAQKFSSVTGPSQPFVNTTLLLSYAVFPSSRSRRLAPRDRIFFPAKRPMVGWQSRGLARAVAGSITMRSSFLVSVFVTLLFASFAYGQNQPRGQQPPPPTKAGPYKVGSVTPPHAISDAMFEAFRKQMNEAAQRKNRRALTKLVVGQGFFWLRENGDRADKSKSGVDNLAAALGLNNKDSAGWDMLASFADDPTGGPLPDRNGALSDLPDIPANRHTGRQDRLCAGGLPSSDRQRPAVATHNRHEF